MSARLSISSARSFRPTHQRPLFLFSGLSRFFLISSVGMPSRAEGRSSLLRLSLHLGLVSRPGPILGYPQPTYGRPVSRTDSAQWSRLSFPRIVDTSFSCTSSLHIHFLTSPARKRCFQTAKHGLARWLLVLTKLRGDGNKN